MIMMTEMMMEMMVMDIRFCRSRIRRHRATVNQGLKVIVEVVGVLALTC